MSLQVRGLTVDYPNGHRGLDDVDLEVPSGEHRALVGRSGSGKTTLVAAVLGLLPDGTRVTGSIRVGGQEIVGATEARLRALRGPVVGYVPQDPFAACDPLRTVAHHVASAWRAHGLVPPPGRVVGELAAVGIDDAARAARRHPHTWSGGMLQRATVVAGTAHDPPLTLADEPTSALDAELADDVLHHVRARSGALLLISHDPALVARHTDHVTVLEAGRIVASGPGVAQPRRPSGRVVAAGVPLRSASDGTSLAPSGDDGPSLAPGDVVAEVRHVTKRYGAVTAVDGASVAVRAGEVVGVVGRSGSGKSTLARLLAGLEAPDAGVTRRPEGRGAVMPVFEDPVASLDRRWPLWRTLVEPLRAGGERIGRRRARERAAGMLARVGLADIAVDRRPGSLSVGQAQRVAIARALAAGPALLIADEPTASLDVATADEIVGLLRGVADSGTAVLVISHDVDRLARWADRVLRMTAGRVDEGRVDEGRVEESCVEGRRGV